MNIQVRHISTFLNQWAPPNTKLDYDNVGLLVGDPNQHISRALTCLDVTLDVVEDAIDKGCELIVAHHPLIFKSIDSINPVDEQGKVIYELIKNDISLIAAHTNLDAAFYALETFGQGLAKRRSGRVIALSACLGRFSGPGTAGGLAPYRISKAALNAMVRNFAAEMQWGERGVLVDAVCPGHCRTDMGGPDAPRSAEEGAQTVVWLADREDRDAAGDVVPTGLLWEDREIVPW